MGKIYVPLFLVSMGLLRAQTPITLSNSNMPGGGDTLRYTNVQINSVGNYTQTGTNYTWDFSPVVSTTEGVRNFKMALQTPYFLFFLGLQEYGEKFPDPPAIGPLTITQYYNFYKKQTNPAAFVADGVGMSLNNIPVPSYYSDKDELYKFPMTYPKFDSTTFRFSVVTTSLIPISYSKTGYRITKVDGWGTVTTPYGTENCLRLITTQYSTDSVKTAFGSFPLPNYQRSYQWLTLNSKIPYMEITGNLIGNNFTVTQARYRGYDKMPKDGVGVQELTDLRTLAIYPNPVNDQLFIHENFAGNCLMEIYDQNGRLLRSFTPATGTGSYDVSALSEGVYILKVSAGERSKYAKFIKE